jgi:ATP-binding cassette subfamily B protein
VIFGKIIDQYAINPGTKQKIELIKGAVWWLLVAVASCHGRKNCENIQEYVMRLIVQKFGMQVFNDGLKQTLRLSYQEFEDQRSGETLSVLQKVRNDTEKFITAFINILFSSLVELLF